MYNEYTRLKYITFILCKTANIIKEVCIAPRHLSSNNWIPFEKLRLYYYAYRKICIKVIKLRLSKNKIWSWHARRILIAPRSQCAYCIILCAQYNVTRSDDTLLISRRLLDNANATVDDDSDYSIFNIINIRDNITYDCCAVVTSRATKFRGHCVVIQFNNIIRQPRPESRRSQLCRTINSSAHCH